MNEDRPRHGAAHIDPFMPNRHDGDPRESRDGETVVLRLEEEARFGTEQVPAGAVHVSRRTETRPASTTLSKQREDVSIEHAQVGDDDSGEVETLPDGSVSVPVLEEELVITKRVIVRERIIIRKKVITEDEKVAVDLRRERVEVEQRDH